MKLLNYKWLDGGLRGWGDFSNDSAAGVMTDNNGNGVSFMINPFYLKVNNILYNLKSNAYLYKQTTAFCPVRGKNGG